MILVIHGSDTYRSHEHLKAVREKFLRDIDPSGLNITEIDGTKVSAGELASAFGAAGFLAPKRLIIVRDILQTAKKDLQELLEKKMNAEDEDTIIVLYESGTPKKPTTLYKKAAKLEHAKKFDAPKQQELPLWISEYVNSQKGSIDPAATQTLAQYVGPDLWRMQQEIDKLLHFCKNKHITDNAIHEIVVPPVEERIFDLTDAVGTKNTKKAIDTLADLAAAGSSMSYVSAMLQKHIRTLIQIQSVKEAQSGVSKDLIAKELGIHPYAAQKALAQSQNFSSAQLHQIYTALLNIDFASKTTSKDPQLMLELLFVHI